jgi:ankyrin repeat protein
MAARSGDLEMVQVLLQHQLIDVNLRNRWLEDPLMLAVKGGCTSIVNALVVDHRLTRFSLKRSLVLARDDDIWRVVRSRIEDENSQTLLVRSPRRRIDGL